MVVNATFGGAGHPLAAAGSSPMRVVALYLPLAFVGGGVTLVAGICSGLAAADLGGGTAAWPRRRGAWPRLSAHRRGAEAAEVTTA